MQIETLINSISVFDLLVFVFLVGMFVLGYIQGVVRRLIGIFTVTFSFILAANLRGPVGDFLAQNWTQFPAEYSRMIGFGLVFAVVALAFALVTQIWFKPVTLWPRAPIVEDTVGGLLGVVQGLVILLALIVITDPYFKQASAAANNELPLIRGFHDLLNGSATATVFRDVLIPGFNVMLGAFIPDVIKEAFTRAG